MARPAVVDIDQGYKKIMQDLLRLEKGNVLVGVQDGSVTQAAVKRGHKKKAGFSMAQIAAANEFGTKNIPERSFLRTAVDQNLNKIDEYSQLQVGKVIDRKESPEKAFGLIGQLLTGLIQKKIREIRTPPNAPATIKKKRSSKPLIDFGQLIASIRYKVNM